MKTNKFSSSIENVFVKNTNSKTVLKNSEPRDTAIKYGSESQKKEKIINELKSFISQNSRDSSGARYNKELAVRAFHKTTNMISYSRLVYFYNLTNPDNFKMFKKNVKDGYLLLMLLNMRTVVSYMKVPEDTREFQTKGIKNFTKLFTRKQWKNLITSDPFHVLDFESKISDSITSSFSETFFEDNREIRFYFELLKSALNHEPLTYNAGFMIDFIVSTITAASFDPESSSPIWEKFRTLDKFIVNFYGSTDIFTGLLSLCRRLSPDSNMAEIRDHINLMTEIRRLNKDIEFRVNPNWSLLRFNEEHQKLVLMLNDLKSVKMSKRPILNLKFIDYKNLNNVVLTNDKGVDYEISIKLLNSELELYKETSIMKHCVSTYYTRSRELKYLIFSVTTKNFKNDRYTIGFAANHEPFAWSVIEGPGVLSNFDNQISNEKNIKGFSLEQVKGKFNGSVSKDFPLDKLWEVLYKVVNNEKFIGYLNSKKLRPLTNLKSFENSIFFQKSKKSITGVMFNHNVINGPLYVYKDSRFNNESSIHWSDINFRSYINSWGTNGTQSLKGEQSTKLIKEYLDIFLKRVDIFHHGDPFSSLYNMFNSRGFVLKQTFKKMFALSGNKDILTVGGAVPLIRFTKFENSLRLLRNNLVRNNLVDILIDGI